LSIYQAISSTRLSAIDVSYLGAACAYRIGLTAALLGLCFVSASVFAQENAGVVSGDYVAVPEASAEAMRFYHSGNALWFVRVGWAIGLPALIAFTGFGVRLRQLAQGFAVPVRLLFVPLIYIYSRRRRVRPWPPLLPRKHPLTVSVNYSLLVAIVFLATLPLSYYLGFVRMHEYGLSNQAFGKWLGDYAKGALVQIVIGALVVWVPYVLINRYRRMWWLWTGLLVCPFIFFMALVMPVWIDPLFNDFEAMKDKDLEQSILAVADRAGIEGGRVFEVNKSVDTKALNAYVTGFMNTKRIVLWDTIIAELDEDELLVVMAHEMGHFVLGHVVTGVFFYSAMILLGLFIVHHGAGWMIRRFRGRLRFRALGDAASMALLLMVMQVVQLLLQPPGVAFSRYMEREADRFALEVMQDNEAGARAFVQLQATNLGNPWPGPIYVFMRSTHPPLGKRIMFYNEYRPWETGQPLVYEELFR
jgi:Zn-dependent protease with chaperone function